MIRLLFMTAVGIMLLPVPRAAGGMIRGTVTENGSGDSIGNLRIRIYDINWQIKLSACTWTAADGTYASSDLAAGSYYVRAVSEYPQPWVTQYWYNSAERATAIPVTISGDEPIIGIDFSLEKGGFLSGIIRDSSGYPLVDLDLDLYTADWAYDSRYSANTGEDGDYILGPIPAGQWHLRADPDAFHGVCQQYWPGAWYRDQAQILVLAAGQEIPGVDFSLIPGGSIRGQVQEIRTQMVKPDCEIKAYSLDGIEQPIHTAATDADGLYDAYGLPQGSYYLYVDPPDGCGAAGIFYPDSIDGSGAEPVAVTAGHTVSGIDFRLPEGNFELNGDLDMPTRYVDPGEMFGLTYTITNKGELLTNLPVFVLLDIQGEYFFWPSWIKWSPPEHTGIDFREYSLDSGDTVIDVFPEFEWPETGLEMDGLRFIAAVTNWSMTGLASDVEIIEWSFE